MAPSRIICAALALAALAGAAPAVAQDSIGAKQAEAAALKGRIEAQGRRLSLADEDYNVAVLRRRSLDARLEKVGAEVAAAEARWTDLKGQLGRRIRTLYMHPGASIEAWLGMTSFSEAARARVLSASVLTADGELVDATERARDEAGERAEVLGALRLAAQSSEQDLAAKRVRVASELAAQRALLRGVNAEIAQLIEAERQRQLEEAARLAAEEAARRAAAEATPAPSAGVGEVLPTPAPSTSLPTQSTSAKAAKAVDTARAQIGKPYEWSGEGPNSFDCSGLTAYAWRSAGVSLPHSSRAQYDALPKVKRSEIRPGDLLFYGSPIHHVGIYEGNGIMINAPQTGENVRRDSIARSDFAGAARPG